MCVCLLVFVFRCVRLRLERVFFVLRRMERLGVCFRRILFVFLFPPNLVGKFVVELGLINLGLLRCCWSCGIVTDIALVRILKGGVLVPSL